MATSQHIRRPAPPLRQLLWQHYWRALPLLLLALPLLLFLTLPLLALVMRTRPLALLQGLMMPTVLQAISLSLLTTTISTLLAIAFGTPLAYLLARRQFVGRTLIDTLLDLPLVLPPSVAGIALLLAFGQRGLLGPYLMSLDIAVAFTQVAVIMAQLFVSAPFYIKAATAGFAAVDREIEQAAMVDGAGAWRVFHMITLPLALPALAGGVVMTWARALGEFGATIIFAGNVPGTTQTMPLAIYLGFEIEFNAALTLAVLLLVLSFGILVIMKGVLRQQIGQQ